MNIEHVRERMEENSETIESMVRAVSREQARWKPAPDKWSILEVVCHMCDEEREDFRQRLQLLLEDSEATWPPIDPPGWVTSRAYNERDLSDALTQFLGERESSLAWLATLRDPDWNAAYEHPSLGPITAGSLLVSWMAHDLLHIRQLSRLHYDYLLSVSDGHSADYAGPW